MFHMNLSLNQIFRPLLNLTIFEAIDQHNQYLNEYYIESRRVKVNGELGSSTPLKKTTLNKIAEGLTTSMEPKIKATKIFPNNLILFNQLLSQEKVIWYFPPAIKKLYFNDNIGIKTGNYPTPGLIFRWEEKLSIYAIKSKSINENTILYKAPYPNIGYADVCMGNAHYNVKMNTELEDFIREAEARFFESYFTHTMNNSSVLKGNFVLIYNKMQTEGVFPNKYLQSTNKRLKDIL